MNNHTPGPWSLGEPELVGTGMHIPINAPGHGELAMVVWQMEDDVHDGVSSKSCEANAHALVAAPELLDALRKYEAAFSDMFAQCCSNPVTDAWGKPVDMTLINEAHQSASPAIAKAEGRA